MTRQAKDVLSLGADVAAIGTFLVVATLAGLLVISTAARWLEIRRADAPLTSATPTSVAPMLAITTTGVTALLRRDGARVAIVEFSDFDCPHCRRHFGEVFPSLQSQLIQTGRAAYLIKHFPIAQLHPTARVAAQAFECAARTGHLWRLREAALLASGPTSLGSLRRAAESIGVDADALEQCATSDPEIAQRISADIAEARRLGVRATPTFFIGLLDESGIVRVTDRLVGVRPVHDFIEAVDRAEGLGRRPEPTRSSKEPS